jgi:hypothetical protein
MNLVFDILLIYFQETDYNPVDPWGYTRDTDSISFYLLDQDSSFLQ